MIRRRIIVLAIVMAIVTVTDSASAAPPTASIQSPASPVKVPQGATVALVIRGQDSDGDLRLSEVYLDGVFQGHTVFTDGYDGTATWIQTFETAGTYTVSFNCLDWAGNYGTGGVWTVEADVAEAFGLGTLELTLGPGQAVDAGAAWKVAGHTDWLDSGHVAEKLPPGYHNVQFKSVVGCSEPRMFSVYVIADLATSKTAEYRPLPAFDIGRIPPQKPPHGSRAAFYVYCEKLGPGASLSMTVGPQPVGPISLDPDSGLFIYEPNDPEDRTPFEVTFTATAGADPCSQTIEITPVPNLPLEHTIVSDPVHTLPEPDSRDYVFVNEVLSDADEDLNGSRRPVRSVTIAGKMVVFGDGHANGLYDSYNYGPGHVDDIKEMTIYAETLVVTDPLRLPQTNVTIYARELRFEGAVAEINTTPIDFGWTVPGRGENGQKGLRAGDITLYVESLTDGDPKTRFIMNGGPGQPPGPGLGRNPASPVGADLLDGASVPPVGYRWYRCPYCGDSFTADYPVYPPAGLYCYSCGEESEFNFTPWEFYDHFTYVELLCRNSMHQYTPAIYGSKALPTAGTDATAAGIPGIGGDGGNLLLTVQIPDDSAANIGGPSAGPANGGNAYKGGYHGKPNPAYHGMWVQWSWAWRRYCKYYVPGTQANDAPAPSAASASGTAGEILWAPRPPLTWLSPYALKMVLAHAKDAYLYGHLGDTRDILREYHELLNAYMALPKWNDLSEQWQFEFEQMDQEIIMLLHRLDNGLDYFGNRPNWVPALSFEFFKQLYDNEVSSAIGAFYLSYWVQNTAQGLEQRVQSLENARTTLWDQTQQFKADYATTAELLTQLKDQAAAIASDIGAVGPEGCSGMLCQLKYKETELLGRAHGNVAASKKIPKWKKIFRVIGCVVTAGVSAATSIASGDVGGVIEANVSLFSDLSAAADEFHASDHPFEEIGSLENVARKFNGSGFDQATSQWLDGFNQIDNLAAIEANGVDTYLEDLGGSAAQMANGLYDVKEAMKATSLSNEEVDTELKKIKASDPTFNRLVDQVTELMARKELFNRQLAAAMQNVTALSNGITNNLLAIDSMNRDTSNLNRVIDPRCVMYVKDMEQRARERLLKYHYYMAKAYEYRFLQPYTGDLKIQDLVDGVIDMVEAGKGSQLTEDDFEVLKGFYEQELAELTDGILQQYLAPGNSSVECTAPITLTLSQDELDTLNSGQAVTFNLVERGLFFDDEENHRLLDVTVVPELLQLHVEGTQYPDDKFDLRVKHCALSDLQRNGLIYRFSHQQGEQNLMNQIHWTVRYLFADGSLVPVYRSNASNSLLWSLLDKFGQATNENALLYTRPAAWADISIEKKDHLNNPHQTTVVIDNLCLKIWYDFSYKDEDLQTLTIITEPNAPTAGPTGELLPYFVIDQFDATGRRDGRGEFRRAYNWHQAQEVVVAAPETYGNWKFEQWTDRYGYPLIADPMLTIEFEPDPHPHSKRADQMVVARYGYDGPMFSATDFNKDFYVDFTDYGRLSDAWLTEPGDDKWDAAYDISTPADDVIDMRDIAEFAESWLTDVGL